MHGTIMLLLFATPLFAGFANVIMPLQIGAPDVAFPRLNMLSYWLYLLRRPHRAGGLLHARRARRRSAGSRTRRCRTRVYSPGVGGDLWVFGLALGGFGTILGAVNFITTIVTHARARHDDVPDADLHLEHARHVACWCSWPSRRSPPRCFALGADRRLGAQVFNPENGGAILWQHLFWFFGHPEVYIIALPFFGIVTEILPVFSRKPIFGYKGLVYATIAIAALSVTVWAHHMYVTGAVLLPFFAFMTMLIAVPTGVKFFNWIGTMWRGQAHVRDADALGDRLPRHVPVRRPHRHHPGSPAARLPLSDTYFVVAHFHYVVFGTVVFAMFAGFYFWWPKFTGRMLNERLGKIHFWLTVHRLPHDVPGPALARASRACRAGTRTTCPRTASRWLNQISTVGAFILGAVDAAVPVERLHRRGASAPQGHGRRPVGLRQLARVGHVAARRRGTTSRRCPRIRSERPAFDLHHPEVAAMDHVEPDPGSAATGRPTAPASSEVANDRLANGTGEQEQSSATIVEDRPRGPTRRTAMKVETKLFLYGVLFFFPVGLVYGAAGAAASPSAPSASRWSAGSWA